MEYELSTEELEILKSKLPKSYREIITEMTKHSRTSINRFFNGEEVHEDLRIDILECCVDLINEKSERAKKVWKDIKKALKN